MIRVGTLLGVWLVLAGCPDPKGTPTPPDSDADSGAHTETSVTGGTAALAGTPSSAAPGPPNFLFLIGDDLGVERLASYQEPTSALGYPATPNLDQLAADGILFRNAYANPVCSPTRFNAAYGRYSRRVGIGGHLQEKQPVESPTAEVSIAEVLADAGYTTTAVGKWHLSSNSGPLNVAHPLLEGFDHFAGTLGNLGADYSSWGKTIDGAPTVAWTGYITSDTVDDALDAANTSGEPWLIWVAFHAPHRPWHVPPSNLQNTGVTTQSSDEEKFHAMIEAMDTEIGRLLAGLDPAVLDNTVVVFLGDNGTVGDFIPASWDPSSGKGTIYEGGTNVPLIIRTPATVGAGVESAALVHAVDLFPTFAELASVDLSRFVSTSGRWDAAAAAINTGAPLPWEAELAAQPNGVLIDGVSFADVVRSPASPGGRDYVYVERFLRNGPPPYAKDMRAVHDGQFKLADVNGVTQLFDLRGRHDDGPDLLPGPLAPDAQAALARLSEVLEAHRRVLLYQP